MFEFENTQLSATAWDLFRCCGVVSWESSDRKFEIFSAHMKRALAELASCDSSRESKIFLVFWLYFNMRDVVRLPSGQALYERFIHLMSAAAADLEKAGAAGNMVEDVIESAPCGVHVASDSQVCEYHAM